MMFCDCRVPASGQVTALAEMRARQGSRATMLDLLAALVLVECGIRPARRTMMIIGNCFLPARIRFGAADT